jgi:O-antigen ligase
MVEVFLIGEGPRTALYLSVANGGTDGRALDAAFHGQGYSGLRESSTMFGPLQFAPLCMTGLIIWWVYCRNPIPGAMIAAGLICSVTRSAWIGTAVAISVLAVIMLQKKRFILYLGLALALFAAAIPVLGLSDYLFSVKTGQDPSAQGHQESIFEGLEYVSDHSLGIGPGNVGKYAVKNDYNAPGFENTYLTLAAEYGVPATLCFLGFLLTILRVLWRARTQLAYVGVGIVIGFGVIMMFAALHDVFPLACWLWFPVGLAIRASVDAGARESIAE